VVTLAAAPQTGWHFTGWSGDTATTANPITLTMVASRAYTASFSINTYTLSVSVVGNGTVTRAPNLATYPHGTAVSVSAVPDPTWRFTGWSGDTTAVANPLSLIMTRDRSLTATFALETHTLAINVSGTGSVTRSPNLPAYDYGTVVRLTAVPGLGWRFQGWSGDLTS